MTGHIIKLSLVRKYGFILPDGCALRSDAHFFHASSVYSSFDRFAVGQAVEFESTASDRGLRAEHVRRLQPS